MALVNWSDSESEEEDDSPRLLTEDEINSITKQLRFGLAQNPVQENIISIHREKTTRKLKTVEIRPSKIADLKRGIVQQFYSSVIAPGEAVGVNAAQCIGEPTTQMTLNSVVWETFILIKVNGLQKEIQIGEWIDEIIDNAESVTHIKENRTEYCELKEPVFIPTVSSSGETSWGKVTAVTRHLPVGNLVRVLTRSGRDVIVTKSKSLLIWSGTEFVQTKGSEAKEGDLLPLMKESHPESHNFATVKDVILDPIVSIEETGSTHPKVYDLTVPSTTNFCLANGLGVADTFHHTGQSTKNVTLGFPRARELFNATRSPSSPNCTIYFTRDNDHPSGLHKFVNKLPEATIDELLTSWEVFDPDDYNLETWHQVWFKLHPYFGDLTADDWCLRLNFNIGKLYDRNLYIKDIASRLTESYMDIRCIVSPLNIGIIDIIVNCGEVTISGDRTPDLEFITDTEEARDFYMKKIVSPKLRGHQACGILGIKQVYRRKVRSNESYGNIPLKKEIQDRVKGEEWIADTDGTNLQQILIQPGVDSYRTLSNDMWEIMNLLGIEAARSYLFSEMMNIVQGSGVSINPVHIQVLVDKMTYTGSIRAIARFGVETVQYDPIARATFEEVMTQIVTSAIFSEKDNLNGISSNIVLGTTINAGTGRSNLEDIPLRVVNPKKPSTQKIVTEDI